MFKFCIKMSSNYQFPNGLSAEQEEILNICNLIMSIFAVAGSSIIVCIYIFVKSSRNLGMKLVVYLCACDGIGSMMNLIDATQSFFEVPGSEDYYCYFEAFFREFIQFAAILWTSLMALILYQSVCLGQKDFERRERKYVLVCMGIPWMVALM